ncbi:MAG TPA: OsmC family protein [Gemmatimonadaceae bacterium]|nr:OsmC family protein [Gemmatimonadaceae bacterium]
MSEYRVWIEWERKDARFTDNKYSRGHTWRFDGGIEVPASSSPHVVALPQSVAAAVDPEEAFVASLSSCHMLWFLAQAAKRGFTVDRYVDDAVGVLGRNADGKLAMLEVTLRPSVTFSGTQRLRETDVDALHHDAHANCFIANSVTTEVRCEPRAELAGR